MTSMRSELGRIEMNKLFQSRKELNLRIRETLEETCQTWGITCDRYEILKIEPPSEVRRSMQLQAEAERVKRKEIILSEAKKFSDINIAEGRKQAQILRAEGHAEALEIKARKEKDGLQLIATTVMAGQGRGTRALDYILKRKYYDEYANILKNANVTVLPEGDGSNGNTDVLGAVAMMIGGNNRSYNNVASSNNSNTITELADLEQKARGASKTEKKKPAKEMAGQQADRGHKNDSNVDWNSISFFNNTNLDSTDDRRK